MKKLIILILFSFLFSFSTKELSQIIDSNSSKIKEIIHSKDGIYLLEVAIWKDRFDILLLAKKEGFDFNTTDYRGNNLLMLASFLAKSKFVKFLVNNINPNEVNINGLNSLQMVLAGVNQINSEKFLKNENFREDVYKTIKILKQNYAKFEYKGNYYKTSKIIYHINEVPDLVKNLLFALMNDKQKMFAYLRLNKENKAKEILKSHPEFLKDPYFLDFPNHFLWILTKFKEYSFIEYMLKTAKKQNINLLDYIVTDYWAKQVYDIDDKMFWTIANKYIKPIGKYEKMDFDKLREIPFKAILNKDYKLLDDFTKYGFWNFPKLKVDIDVNLVFRYYTPLLLAIELNDKKAVDILLKNGGYMSGWNEFHYKILKNKPLNLDKYHKWERVYKINEGGLLDSVTPLTLALMYNPKYVDELLKFTKKIDKNTFYFAIKQNLEDKLLPYVSHVDRKSLILLLEKKRVDVIKKLVKRKIISDWDIKELGDVVKNNKEILNFMLKKYLLKQCKENEAFLVYPKVDRKSVLKCLKAGYKFSDDSLLALIQDGNDTILSYLVKYKNHKLRGKYYPIMYLTNKKFLDKFTTSQNKDQRVVAECQITHNKETCKKAIYKAIELKNYNLAANLSVMSNQPYLVKDYLDKIYPMFKMCYYLQTDPKKAKKFAKKTKAKCPHKIVDGKYVK